MCDTWPMRQWLDLLAVLLRHVIKTDFEFAWFSGWTTNGKPTSICMVLLKY